MTGLWQREREMCRYCRYSHIFIELKPLMPESLLKGSHWVTVKAVSDHSSWSGCMFTETSHQLPIDKYRYETRFIGSGPYLCSVNTSASHSEWSSAAVMHYYIWSYISVCFHWHLLDTSCTASSSRCFLLTFDLLSWQRTYKSQCQGLVQSKTKLQITKWGKHYENDTVREF